MEILIATWGAGLFAAREGALARVSDEDVTVLAPGPFAVIGTELRRLP